ncbi:MAG: hypothetical protein KIT16_00030 [Rhodospirillaceae bacterium]|nr:hypothetical protein [Rhodospirillaceae bacterium]
MIPRIVHQTWRDAEIPAPLRRYAETWKRLHPGWTYRLWTDADLAELIEQRFGTYAAMYRDYPVPIMRADLGRYLVLKAHGGVFADLDAEALRPWDELTGDARPILFEEPSSHAELPFVRRRGFARIVSNALIASPPAHPFWDHLLDLLRRCRYARNPRDATGPFALTAAIARADGDTAPKVLPAWLVSAADNLGSKVAPPQGPPRDGAPAAPLAAHHWMGSWWHDGQTWPAGYAQPRSAPRLSWRERMRERRALARLAATVAAARALPSRRQLPTGKSVLVAVPVRDAATTLDALLAAVTALDYPKASLSLAFLEGDSSDDSYARLAAFARAQEPHYARIVLRRSRTGFPKLARRWEPALQRSRRAHLARVRNRLLRLALRDEDWVLWLDADVIGFPTTLLADLLAARAPVVQPNTVVFRDGPTFDANGWLEERALSEDAMRPYILDGLYGPPAGYERLYLSDMRYRDRVNLDSVGGTALLVDAGLHRAGIDFPETPYRYLIETEGFGAILRDVGVPIVGLPGLEVLHANA